MNEPEVSGSDSFGSWLRESIASVGEANRARIFMVCWAIWRRRNDRVWNFKEGSTHSVLLCAESSLQAWLNAQDRELAPLPTYLSPLDGAEVWSKPNSWVLKLNVDAANFIGAQTYAYAGIVRDHNGGLIEAFSVCRNGVINPELGEALGVPEALSWIKRRQWSNVVVETDSLLVVQALRTNMGMTSYFGNIIDDCKLFLRDLVSVSVYFVKRSANEAANALARSSSVVAERTLVRENFPSSVLDVIFQESL